MAVSSAAFASQLVAPGELPRFFDDLGCLADYLKAGKAPAGATAFVADHRTRAWVRADRAVYTRVPGLETPMGSHAIAHADAASRDADPDARTGQRRLRGGALRGGGRARGGCELSGLAIRGALYRRAPRPPWAAHLRLFAREELVLALRSRWTQIFAVVFGVLAFAVAGAGYVLSGGHGVQDFARTAVSLVQLVLLLVPLTALVIGVLSLAPERGAAELLFSQPVSRRTILLGKLLGLFQALAAAQAVGFGAAGAVVYGQSGSEGLSGFLLLVGASLVTTAVFLGIAALLSAGAVGRKRTRALALALVVWFVAVVLFDLAALGLASVLPSGTASRVLIGLGDREPDRRRANGDAPGHRGHRRVRRRLAGPLPLHPGRLGHRLRPGPVPRLLARGAHGPRGAPPAEGGCLSLARAGGELLADGLARAPPAAPAPFRF